MAYASDSLSLAALEVLVHSDASTLMGTYSATPVDIPDDLARTVKTVAQLPAIWRNDPAPTALQQIGDAWLDAAVDAILVVPSAVVPEQSNYLLNPAHPDFGHMVVGAPQPFVFDPRLKR